MPLFNGTGPFRGAKGDVYEGGLRVPMIARWPERIAPGTVSDYPWAFWDLLPTAADLAGVKAPKTDGVSVLPVLLGKRPPRRGITSTGNRTRRGSIKPFARASGRACATA